MPAASSPSPPSPWASAWPRLTGVGGRRRAIAVLIDHIDHFGGGYESLLRVGFEEACAERDLDLFVFVGHCLEHVDPRERMHNTVYDLVRAGSVDAAILVTGGLGSISGVAGVERLCRSFGELPLVSLGMPLETVPSVVLEQTRAMRELVRHIADHGRRRVVFLGGPELNPDSALRLQVCREMLAQHGISLPAERVAFGHFNYVTGISTMTEILERGVPFDAVLAANDGMAAGAMSVLSARGLRIPEDVTVTGFDDLELARFADPPMTTVRQPLKRMARIAVTLAIQQWEGKPVRLNTEVSAELVIRHSCGCNSPVLRRPSGGSPPDRGASALRLRGQIDVVCKRIESQLNEGDPEWVRSISYATLAEAEGEAGALSAAFQRCIAAIGRERALYDVFDQMLGLLWRELSGFVPELEAAFGHGREQLLRAQNRAQGQHILHEELTYMQIVDAGERLSTVLDLPMLKRSLAEVVPALGIRNAFVSLYVDESRAQLEPFFCMHGGSLVADPGGPFPAAELVPTGMRAFATRRTLFALPLTSEGRHWGVAVVEFGDGIGANEFLREQLSAALATVAHHREIIDKTKLHERSVQERLATAERIDSLSILAGGVAHDLNNALGPLVALPDLIKSELERVPLGLLSDGAEVLIDLEYIKSAALRAAQTIGDLLTLGRQGRTALLPLELSRTIMDCVSESRVRFPSPPGEASRVLFAAANEPLTIRGASQQLRRAISNLVQNAIEASPAGAQVTLASERLSLREPFHGYETVAPGEYAVVTVSDRGPGIPEPERARIFEPFFSSKRLQERSGSGLGLAIVHGVVKEHGGFLDVRSEIGGGSRFTLFLPITEDYVPQSQVPPLAIGGSARVLVVDDDLLQRRSTKRVLTHLGYDVTTLACGEQAIRSFVQARARAEAAGPCPFDLVVMDVQLNGKLDGLQVIEQLRACWPELKCLVVSGHAEPQGVRPGAGELFWLAKPFEGASLAHAVREALAHEPRPSSVRSCA